MLCQFLELTALFVEILIRAAELVFGSLALGNIGADGSDVGDFTVGRNEKELGYQQCLYAIRMDERLLPFDWSVALDHFLVVRQKRLG